MESVKQLYEIFEPFENKILKITEDIDLFTNLEEIDRLKNLKDTFIVMLLRAFKESPIEIKIDFASGQLKYIVYWVDRKKYFKESKKELIEFFNKFIRLVHSDKLLILIDIKLMEDKKIVMLVEKRGTLNGC